MCYLCGHSRDRACSLDPKPAIVRVTLRSCPIGRHPDDQGRVRWWGVTWRGVPAFLRPLLPKPDQALCGCVDRLKGWTERIHGAVQAHEPTQRWAFGALALLAGVFVIIAA